MEEEQLEKKPKFNFVNPDFKTLTIVFLVIAILLLGRGKISELVKADYIGIDLIEESHTQERILVNKLFARVVDRTIVSVFRIAVQNGFIKLTDGAGKEIILIHQINEQPK